MKFLKCFWCVQGLLEGAGPGLPDFAGVPQRRSVGLLGYVDILLLNLLVDSCFDSHGYISYLFM